MQKKGYKWIVKAKINTSKGTIAYIIPEWESATWREADKQGNTRGSH